MPSPATSSVRLLFSILMVAIAYSLSLSRIIKGNRGNRVVECGSMALIVALLMVILIGFPNLPDWVQPSLGLLFLTMSLLTIFFVLLRGVQAIRRRKSSPLTAGNPAMYELEYEHRNTAEKWLSRIAYWGAMFFAAFIWWEVVKAH